MEIKTEEGIATGFPASDLQDNNKRIENLVIWLKMVFSMLALYGTVGFMLLVYIAFKYDVLVRAVNMLLSIN